MLATAVASVRQRPVAIVGAVVSVAAASALVAAAANLVITAAAGEAGAGRFSGAAAVVRADDALTANPEFGDAVIGEPPPVPQDVVRRLRSVPGVLGVIPDFSFYAQAIDSTGRAIPGADEGPSNGHPAASMRLSAFSVRSGRPPSAPGEVALDADLAARARVRTGDRVAILTPHGRGRFRVVGIVAPPRATHIRGQSALFFAPATARRLAERRSRAADAVGVIGAPGAESLLATRIAAGVENDHLQVLTGSSRGRADAPEARPDFATVIEVLGTLAGLASFAGVFILSSTFAFAVAQRHRELAVLRAVAATPRQIRVMLALEAIIVGAIGLAIGAAAAPIAAEQLAAELVRRHLAPTGFAPHAAVPATLVAAVIALGLTQAAVWLAARRAARIDPVEALREAELPSASLGRARRAAGALLLLGTAAAPFVWIELGQPLYAVTPIAVLALTIATAALAPFVLGRTAEVAARVTAGLTGTAGRLAAANISAFRRRAATLATPVALLLTLVGGFLLIQTAIDASANDQARERLKADVVLVAQGAPGLPHTVEQRVARIPGVAAAVGVVSTSAYGEFFGDPVERPAVAVDPHELEQVLLALDVVAGRLSALRRNSVAISNAEARSRAAAVGDVIRLRMHDGTLVERRIAAIFRRSLGFADFIFTREDAYAHSSNRLDSMIHVRLRAGGNGAAVEQKLESLRDRYPTVRVLDRSRVRAAADRQTEINRWGALLLDGLIGVFIGIGIANTLVLATADRTREFGVARLIGATRMQVLGMVALETILIIVAATAVATALVLLVAALLHQSLGASATPVPDVRMYGSLVAAASGSAIAATMVPAWLALRRDPVGAARFVA